MIGLKINNVFLDLNRNTALQFDLKSFSYITSGLDNIRGGFSYTISLPRSDHNLAALRHPHRIDSYYKLIDNEDIEFHFQGIPLFKGKAHVRLGGSTIKLYMILNEISTLKDTLLSDIDLGGDRAFGGIAEALTTAQNHLSYDFTFFPIRNHAFFSGYDSDPATSSSKVQNYFSGGAFVDASDQLNAMPFIRLEYLISQIFNEIGYSLDNQFQTDDEWRSLYLYNNVSFYKNGSWPSTINLANHAPKLKVSEFLKHLISQFNLGIFLNPFTRSSELVRIEDIVAGPPSVDWTSKVAGPMTFSTNKVVPGKLRYAIDDNDGMMTAEKYQQEFTYDPHIDDGDLEYFPMAGDGVLGYHWIDSMSRLYYFAPGYQVDYLWYSLRHKTIDDGEPFDGQLIPLLQDGELLEGGFEYGWPKAAINGSMLHDEDWQNDFTTRITFYRGIQGGKPFACSGRYETSVSHTSQFDRSLYWYDDYGIYANCWRKTLGAFSRRKDVSVSLDLSLPDLQNFSFKNKIRIGNMNYIVARLRPTFLQTGLGLTKADLITCI